MKKLFKNYWFLVISIAAFVACNDEDIAPVITKFELNDTTIHVGTHLEIEASVQSEHVFNYNWILNGETKSNRSIFVFTPEKSGDYILKLIVENKYGTDSTEALITVLPRLITIDFENLPIQSNSYWNGADGSKGFTSGIASFPNIFTYDPTYPYWEGFAYSNRNDTINEGYMNQYSVYDPKNNGNKFVVFYPPFFGVSPIEFKNKQLIIVQSLKICNNTYTALSMLNGDRYAKKFGGSTGNDADSLKLKINGLNASGQLLSSIDFYLADYRFANNLEDYIVRKWTEVDLTKLGAINQISFSFESSDNGGWGMNTPSYFCIDDIVYLDPEN